MRRSADASHPETALIAPLHRFAHTDRQQAGGKGANLGELLRANFPVPPGYIVTTAAYDQFVAANDLAPVLNQVDNQGDAIRAAFEKAPIPPPIAQAILAAQQQLDPGKAGVAVRSSATAEDLPEAAFAGQQDTYLNIVGTEALLQAVRQCWASLWTGRAIAYRERLGLDQQTVKMAVVVQRLVAAEAAGVLFTANTVSGARDEMVIAASPGLGEAVVAGLVTPDHVILRQRLWGWRIVERRLGRREVIIQARPGGGTEQMAGATAAEVPTLPDRALQQLARLGAAIQHHFGSPQDVEWAWADGQPFILQARPITALPTPLPRRQTRANKLQRLLASNFAEMMPVRPYPLDMDTWIPTLAGAIEPLFRLLGLEWRLSHLFDEEEGIVVRLSGKLPRPTWRMLFTPPRLFWLIWRYDPVHWQSDPLLIETIARARDLESQALPTRSWPQMLATVQAAQAITLLAAGELRRRYFPRAVLAVAQLRLLLSLLGASSQLGTLLSGAENKTLEANRALEELAERVRSEPELAATFSTHEPQQLLSALERVEAQPGFHRDRSFLVALRAFLERYGHRETVISTAFEPTWKDAPAVVLGIVKSFASHPPQLTETGQPAWQVTRDELLAHRLLRLAPLRSAFLRNLAEARALLQIREDTHFYATLPMPVLRRTFLELGRRLVSAGTLETAADIFHLKLAELERIGGRLPPPPELAAELRALIRQRKAARARLEGTPLVDPRLLPQSAPAAGALLRGLPGSPGIAQGPARILRDGSEFDKLVAGDVLVAPYTNPSWTPLFQRAVAVIVDSGSPASHAAIVAREYGIPAVMGTVTGTRTIRDGEEIRVDGNQGLVFSLRPLTAQVREAEIDNVSGEP